MKMDRVTGHLEAVKTQIDNLIFRFNQLGKIEGLFSAEAARTKRPRKKVGSAKPKKTNGKVIHYRGVWGQYAKLTKGLDKTAKKKLDVIRKDHGLKAAVTAAKELARAN